MRKFLLPIEVTPPPCSVARLTVTYSRNTLSSPTVTLVGSPLYPRCCGGPPIETNGCSSQRSPISVHPSTVTCDSSLVPLPTLTCSPTTQNRPMTTSSTSFAFG